jgi:xanthine dehydrogenase accessory factor
VLVVGDTPIATAVRALGAELGLDLVAVEGGVPEPSPGDLALVVAAHGRDELHTLRRGLETGLPYIGLVASRRRGAGVIAELRADGVSEAQLGQIDVPAGLDIAAGTASLHGPSTATHRQARLSSQHRRSRSIRSAA